MRARVLGPVMLLLASVSAAQAQDEDSASAAQFAAIPWEKGPILGDLGAEAQIGVPDGCLFTTGDGVRQFNELTQNPTGENERAIVFCSGEQEPWFVVFSFDPSGYVKDDERDKLDADAILGSLQKGTEVGNKERRKRGWATLTVEGWARAPYYDAKTNNLTWATRIVAEGGGPVINHSVRLLGRGGVMHADLVASPDDYDLAVPAFDSLIGDFSYRSGHKYAEWRKGDKVAAYGLAALVAGGAGVAMVNSGLLAKFWKAIVAGVVALGAGLKRLFSRNKSGDSRA